MAQALGCSQLTLASIRQRYAYAKTVLSLSISSDLIRQFHAISDAALSHSISLGSVDCFQIFLISRTDVSNRLSQKAASNQIDYLPSGEGVKKQHGQS